MGASLEGARQEIAGLLGDPPPGALLADARGPGPGPGGRPRRVLPLRRRPRHRAALGDVLPARPDRADRGAAAQRDRRPRRQPVRRPRRARRYRSRPLTPHDTPRSRRLHEILPTDGYRSELRLALVTPGHYWGALSLFRDDPHRPFSDQDVEHAHALVPLLSGVLRRYQVGRPTRRPGDAGAGRHGLPRPRRRHRRDGRRRPRVAGRHVEPVDRRGGAGGHAALRPRGGGEPRAGGAPAVARTRVSGGGWLVASGSYVGGSDVDVVVQLRSGTWPPCCRRSRSGAG